MTDKTCAERIDVHYESRMEDLRKLWAAFTGDECPECGGIGEVKKSPKSKAKNPKMVECKLCKGDGTLNEDSYADELGNLFEYGLSFDYCTPDKESDGYFRYQLSWGGPSDEFRIFADRRSEYDWIVYKVEYWFLDWFDGAHVTLFGDDLRFIRNLFESFFAEVGSASSVYDEAMKYWEPEDEEDDDEELHECEQCGCEYDPDEDEADDQFCSDKCRKEYDDALNAHLGDDSEAISS